jgi:bifunctional non-homologous end joining protein LigD
LGKIKGGNQFDIKSSPARLKRLRKDPWDGIDKVHQDLHSVLQRLGGTR